MGISAGKPGKNKQGFQKHMSDVAQANFFVQSIGGGGKVNDTLYRALKKLKQLYPHEREPRKQWTERRLRAWWNNETDIVRHWQMVELYEAAETVKNEKALLNEARREHAEFIEKTARMASLLELADPDFHSEQIAGFRSVSRGLDMSRTRS